MGFISYAKEKLNELFHIRKTEQICLYLYLLVHKKKQHYILLLFLKMHVEYTPFICELLA